MIAVVFAALAVTFTLLPILDGDDWETFYGAAQRVAHGTPLYGELVTESYYSNPPWLATLLVPLGLLPIRWGLGILSAGTMVALLALARRYAPGGAKFALIALSPATLYIFIHGQIDALILAGVLLPREWWPLIGLTKPQVAAGLIAGVRRETWIRAATITGLVFVANLVVFGPWPIDLLQQPTPFRAATHNLWLGLWPFQVPVGVALVLLGIEKDDERLLFAASPFLFPYATTSSLIGPWLALVSRMKSWQAAFILAVWWGAVLFRALGGM